MGVDKILEGNDEETSKAGRSGFFRSNKIINLF
jgi:hypothetical protein